MTRRTGIGWAVAAALAVASTAYADVTPRVFWNDPANVYVVDEGAMENVCNHYWSQYYCLPGPVQPAGVRDHDGS